VGDLWYPSLVVNLRLRFDETFQISEIPEPGPSEGDPEATSAGAATISAITSSLRRVSGAAAAVARRVAMRPLIAQTGANNLSFVMNRVPRSATVELPGYRQAGKFTLEFDWRELPIDPRLVRSSYVEIFAGSVSPSDFASGMTRVEADGRRRSILNVQTSAGLPRKDLLLLAGNVDDWFTSHTGEGGMVKISGRDLRGDFLDAKVNPAVAAKLDLTKPVTEVVADLLSSTPVAQYLKILYIPQDWPKLVPPSVADKEGLTRVRRKADGDKASAGGKGDDLSFWDLITQYCLLVGAIPFFRGSDIVIRPTTSVFDPSKPRAGYNAETVFDPSPRYADDGQPFEDRKMIFGRNIRELTFERKLKGVKVPVVEIVSLDTSSKERGPKKLLTVEWPPRDKELARISGVSPSGEVAQSDKITISVPGIRDRNKLLGIARAIYEEVGRGELGGSCKTGVLSSYKGSNEDPDLLRLRPGDPVEFRADIRALTSQAPGASTYIDDKRLSFAEQVQKVKAQLSGKAGEGDENLARVLVASSRSMIVDFLSTFRTANVQYSWSTTQGLQISFDFQNYFVVRHGINEQLGKNVIPPVEAIVASTGARKPKKRIPAQPEIKAPPKGEGSRLSKPDEKGFIENTAGAQEFF
jgi:hypothetical protein